MKCTCRQGLEGNMTNMTNKGPAPSQRRIAVVGAGASGCMAAIAAAREGCLVDLYEKNEKIGKKIYATGNGRCNLTNLAMDRSCYHTGGRDASGDLIGSALERFSVDDLLRFFAEAGVPVHDREGYVYPRTDQAETVALALEKCMRSCGVRIHTGCEVLEIRPLEGHDQRAGMDEADGSFLLRVQQVEKPARNPEKTKASRKKPGKSAQGQALRAVRREDRVEKHQEMALHPGPEGLHPYDAVILSTGGLAGPAFGCSGDGYRFAQSFRHSITEPVPALTKLVCGEPLLRRAAGVRCHASITLVDGREDVIREEGELQITEDCISGIPVFQLSGTAARLLLDHRKLTARIDFLPEFSGDRYEEEVSRRLAQGRGQMLGTLMLGLVHRKLIDLVLAMDGLQAEMKAKRLTDDELRDIFRRLRRFELAVIGTGSYDQAQVTSGGVPLAEVSPDFQSLVCPGLYLAGELLDVDGRCGGYNLQWAFSTGFLAGRAASGRQQHISHDQQQGGLHR